MLEHQLPELYFDMMTHQVKRFANSPVGDRFRLIPSDVDTIIQVFGSGDIVLGTMPILSQTYASQAYKVLWQSNQDTVTSPPLGQKFDSGKLRYSLLPQGTLEPVIHVLEYGAKKYCKGNWQHVENARERYYDAAMRHLCAWFNGESKDPETNQSHLAHAICCLMFLLWFEREQ